MAEGNTNIDTLEIEVKASSEDAVQKVKALTEAIKNLQNVTKQKFGDVFKRIDDIGKDASDAQKNVRKKREALDRATGRDSGGNTAKEAKDAAGLVASMSKMERELDRARKLRDKIGNEIIAIQEQLDQHMAFEPRFRDNGAIADLKIQLETLERQALETEGKIRSLDATLGGIREQVYNGGDIRGAVSESTAAAEAEKQRAKSASDSLKELKRQIASINALRLKLPSELAQAEIQAVKTDGRIADMRRKLQTMSETKGLSPEALSSIQTAQARVNEFAEAAQAARARLEDLRHVQEVLKDYTVTPEDAQKDLEFLRDMVSKYQEANSAAKLAGELARNAMAETASRIKSSKPSKPPDYTNYWRQLRESIKAVSSAAGDALKRLLALGGSGVRSALKGLGDAAKSVGKHIADRITSPFRKAIDVVGRWKKAIGKMAFYRMIRSAISAVTNGFRTGIQNLYQYSKLVGTEFAPAMNSLATSALYLKNSLGAMAAPLIQALAPAIDFIIDKFVALLNIIGKVFAALTGKSVYTQAKKHAVEYGDAAKKASKATKDFLLGIDELNVLNNANSGGNGAASDFGSMFEEVEIPNEITDWAKKIRDAIDNGEWRKVGEIIAEKLNEVVDKWDSYGWGQRLGQRITNALNVAYGFLKEFDFDVLGSKVADALNGIMDRVDWDLLGRVFAAGWNATFDFIYGLITQFHWDTFGVAVSDGILGFFSEIDWNKPIEILKAGVEGIRQAFVGMLANFGDTLQIRNVTDPLIEVVNTVAATIKTLISDTQEWIGKLNFGPMLDAFGNLLSSVSALTSVISDGLLWCYENVLLPVASWTIEAAVPDVVNYLAEAIRTLTDALKKIDFNPIIESVERFFESVSPLVEIISDGLMWCLENVMIPLSKWIIEDAAPASVNTLTAALEAVSEVAKIVKDAVQELWTALQPVFDWIGDTAVKYLGTLSEAFTTLAQVIDEKGEKINHILEAVGKAISLVWSIADPILTFLREKFGATFQFIAEIVATVAGRFIDVLDGIVTFIEGVFSSDWAKAWEGVKEIFKGVWNGIVGIFESSVNFVVRILNSFIRGLNRIQVPDWVPVIGGKGFHIKELNTVSIPRLADGGILSKGQLFIAREAGPELVGRIGSNSAVANNTQIIQGIKQGVYEGTLQANKLRSITANLNVPESLTRTLQNIEPVQPRSAVIQNPIATVPAGFRQAQAAVTNISNYTANTNTAAVEGTDSATEDRVIRVFGAYFERLIEAVNENGNVSLDGKTLMQSVERAQRNRGVNIMGGGVLG